MSTPSHPSPRLQPIPIPRLDVPPPEVELGYTNDPLGDEHLVVSSAWAGDGDGSGFLGVSEDRDGLAPQIAAGGPTELPTEEAQGRWTTPDAEPAAEMVKTGLEGFATDVNPVLLAERTESRAVSAGEERTISDLLRLNWTPVVHRGLIADSVREWQEREQRGINRQDEVGKKWHQYADRMEPLLEQLRGARVVELGCGPGIRTFQRMLGEYAPSHYIGVDLGNDFGERTAVEAFGLGSYATLSTERGDPLNGILVNADMLDLLTRLPDGSSSAVVLNGLDFWALDPESEYGVAVIREIDRITAPGGVILGAEFVEGLLAELPRHMPVKVSPLMQEILRTSPQYGVFVSYIKPGGDPLHPADGGAEMPEGDDPVGRLAHTIARAQESPSFEPYRQLMMDINALLEQGVDLQAIQGYVTSGSVCDVFETPDGNLIKMLQQPMSEEEGRALGVRSTYIDPLLYGKGVAGLEQMIAYTEQNGGAVVCERAPGKEMNDLSPEELDAIPPEHFEALMNLCQEIVSRGIKPDFVGCNLFHDPQAGFTIIDYELAADTMMLPDEAARQSTWSILSRGVLNRDGGLRPAASKFLQAYRNAFGDELADAMSQKWHRDRHVWGAY